MKKNKILSAVLAVMLLPLSIMFSGCDEKEVAKFNVKFEYNLDTLGTYSVVQVEKGDMLNQPVEPQKEGYTFDGWFANDNCTVKYDFNTEINSDTTIYAGWTQKFDVDWKITRDFDITTTIKKGETAGYPTIEIDGEDTVLVPEKAREQNMYREGYRLEGWYFDEDYNYRYYPYYGGVAAGFALYAKWVNIGVITFDYNHMTKTGENSVYKLAYADLGDMTSKPTNPSIEHYEFAGWYTNKECYGKPYDFDSSITKDITLYAKWTPIKFNVYFDLNGGTSYPIRSQSILEGSYATMPTAPTKRATEQNKFRFGGWYTVKNPTDDTTKFDFSTMEITKDTVLYAKWIKVYTVTFDVSNTDYQGEQTFTVDVDENNKVSIPQIANPEGWELRCWNLVDGESNVEYDFTSGVTHNITLKAQWKHIGE